MFSAQDNNLPNPEIVPTKPVSPVVPVLPPVPQMVSTEPHGTIHGKRNLSHKLLTLVPVILLVGTMILVAFLLPSLRKSNEEAPLQTPPPSLTPETPLPTQKPDPTQVWKEYLNRDAQLSFRYPSNLSLKETKTSGAVYTITFTKEASSSATVMKIVSARNIKGEALLNSEGEIDTAIKTNETNTVVSGVESKQILSTLLSDPSKQVLYTLVEREDSSYNFVWYAPGEASIYTQILATARFVSPGITAEWQSYSNTKGSYTLRFPPTWSLNTSDQKASASAQTISIRKNQSEAEFQNMVLQTTVSDGKTRIELSASETVSSIQNLSGWKETPTLDFRTIGGAQAQLLSGEREGAWAVYAVMWYRNTLVEVSWRDTLLRQEQETFNDMLGSIVFR